MAESNEKLIRQGGSGKVPKSAYLTFDVLSQYFHLPISVVGKELGVCATMLKKICRKNGIPRWPYRQIKSLNRMIASLEAQPKDDEHVQGILKTLRYKRANLLGNPHMNEPLLRHRKQFRMITKKNGIPSSPVHDKPRAQHPNDLDDMAVGVLSTLSTSSPERPTIARAPSPYGGNYSATPYVAANSSNMQAFGGSTYTVPTPYYSFDGSGDCHGPSSPALSQYPTQPSHGYNSLQAHAQAHAIYAWNHHRQHVQQQVASPLQPTQQAYVQPRVVPNFSQFTAPGMDTYASMPTRHQNIDTPAWHQPATQPTQYNQQAMARDSPPQALKLPEIRLSNTKETSSVANEKLKPVEPGAMSLQRLLAY